MKVLVTGAGGLLGREIWRLFEVEHEMWAIGRTRPAQVSEAQWQECDLTDAARTYLTVTRSNPDLVIHCAAYNNVDGAESDYDMAYRANAMSVRHLALACQRFDSELMAVSSDYVFDGESAPARGYREFDPAHPISRYGESKRWGEIFAEQLLSRFYVVRTSWLFGPARPTWVDTVFKSPDEQKPIQALCDIVSAPTYTPDLAAAMFQLAKQHLFGYYHLTNTGFCSRLDLAQEVLRLSGKAKAATLNVLNQNELKLAARRPAFSALDNLAWRLTGFKPLRPWQEAIGQHFSKLKAA